MPDIYTFIEDGRPNLAIEHFFGKIEQSFVRARSAIEAGAELAPEQIGAVYNFTAAMMVRTPSSIAHWQGQWSRLARVAESVKVRPGATPMPPRFSSSSQRLSLPEVRRLAEDPMGTWFRSALNTHTDVLAKLFRFDILVNVSPHPFLTSDRPTVTRWWMSENDERPQPTLLRKGLGSRDCFITMPISPKFAVLFSHGPIGVQPVRADIGWEGVFETNFMTITRADESIISDRSDLFFVRAVLDRVAEVDG